MKARIIVSGDFGKDIEREVSDLDNARIEAERIARTGVWREDGMFFPAHRIIYVKVEEAA